MTSRDDFRRVQKTMTRGDEIDPADVDMVRRYLESRAVYGRQRLVIDVVLMSACLVVVIALGVIGDRRAGDFVLLALAAVLRLPSLRRHYRIRRWCVRHPDIAGALYEPEPPDHDKP